MPKIGPFLHLVPKEIPPMESTKSANGSNGHGHVHAVVQSTPPRVATPVLTPAKAAELAAPRPPAADPLSPPAIVPPPSAARRPGSIGTGRSMDDVAERATYAKLIASSSKNCADLIARVRAEYGLGLSGDLAAELIGEVRGRRRVTREVALARRAGAPAPAPAPAATPLPAPPRPRAVAAASELPAAQIEAAMDLLLAEVPGLRELRLEVVEGEPRITFRVETVQAGAVTMRRRG
jgi:2-oxoglutarate dehydrogenase E2 component (dihydrolipoamide succinyltransferase)